MTATSVSFRHTNRLSTLLLTAVCSMSFFSMNSGAASQAELKGVSGEISRQQKSLSQQKQQLDSLQKQLKQQELGISNVEKEIRQTRSALAKTEDNIKQLEANVTELEQQQTQQSKQLEELLKTYYITKRAKATSNLLNNDAEADRISQYFQYLAKQRANVIKELEQTVTKLDDNRRQLDLQKQQTTALLEKQTRKRDQLAKGQSERQSTVSKIKKSISGDQVYLSELRRNETRLKAEIAKAAKRNNVPMDGLARHKGKLPWPVEGRILHRYGSAQTGQLNWKGLVIDANYGEAVKAVYSGRVVFADYLRGYGLVVLLDHGKGDMTLYGFNQSLLKKEGDKVKAGDTIARAGNTGGQSQASLYFEIRRNSVTQNPTSWLRR
ncbi:murein hydrolase activator EnvC family protein [Vibrio olivae]|uniref:Murein hydrolase activator EnvC family protein n=1 Tax=Vibrio olivae TaxID=1243002 RepID=A0ABV5HTU8_9VIBR